MLISARRFFYTLNFVFLVLCPSLAIAAQIDEAVRFLETSQQVDGFWLSSETRNVHTATEVLRTLQDLGDNTAVRATVADVLEATPVSDTDDLARRIGALAQEGRNVSSAVNDLLGAADTLGGWGLRQEFSADPLDTALALIALGGVGSTTFGGLKDALVFLVSSQNPDGGWACVERVRPFSPSDVSCTAQALLALNAHRTQFNVEAAIVKGIAFLRSQLGSDGHIGGAAADPIFTTALAARALLSAGDDLGNARATVFSFLESQQRADGSWGGDPFLTAVALRVLSGGRPVITSVPVITAKVKLLYRYQVAAEDLDVGDVLAFSLGVFPTGMTIDSVTGLIEWGPVAGQEGVHQVTVTVRDSRGLIGTQNFMVTVVEGSANEPPVITSFPITTTILGRAFTYDLEATDPDVGDVVTFQLDDAPNGMRIIAETGLIEWTPTSQQVGPHTVTARAKDPADLFASQTFTITVLDIPGGLGTIVLNNDEWTLSNEGFRQSPDAGIFARNIAAFFTGGTGALHAYSTSFAYTESNLRDVFENAGHTYTTGTNIPFDLATLSTFDGIFLGGKNLDAAQIATLVDYVKAGGNVYLSFGNSFTFPEGVADAWNPFLNEFGHSIAEKNNGIIRNIDVTGATHPIFSGVSTLYQASGQSISGPGIQVFLDDQGLYAVVGTGLPADLTISNIEKSGLIFDGQALTVTGGVSATITNQGVQDISTPFEVVFFEDLNNNKDFDEETDQVLGTTRVSNPLLARESILATASLSGPVRFSGALIWSFVDSGNAVNERNEGNNLANCGEECRVSGTELSAADLTASFVEISNNSAQLVVSARLGNGGAVGVPAGVSMAFYDGDPQAGGRLLGTSQSATFLTPGQFEDISITLPGDATSNSTIWVVADDRGGLIGLVEECNEENNIHNSGIDLGAPPTSPTSIEIGPESPVCVAGSEVFPVSLTLPSTSLTKKVDIFFLVDDTQSAEGLTSDFAANFSSFVNNLTTSLPSVDFAFGVGRFEDFGGPGQDFSGGLAVDRPFILNQPILATSVVGFEGLVQTGLMRSTPGSGGDTPESVIEALYQVATGNGFDGDGNGSMLDSGAAGEVGTQTAPSTSGDVPPFSSNVAPVSGNLGGAGWRDGALRLVVLVTDGTAVSAYSFTDGIPASIAGPGGDSVPSSAFSSGSNPDENRAGFIADSLNKADSSIPDSVAPVGVSTVPEAINALNALGIRVMGLAPGASPVSNPTGPSTDPSVVLSALALLTGATNETGTPLVFDIAGGVASFRDAVLNGVTTTATGAVDMGIRAVGTPSDVNVSPSPVSIPNVLPGDTVNFNVTITGMNTPQGNFTLEFFDIRSNTILGTIPVSVQCLEVIEPFPDADGDGFTADVDCDDTDLEVNPGATEILGNGKDDDCNPGTPDQVSAEELMCVVATDKVSYGAQDEIAVEFTLTRIGETTGTLVGLQLSMDVEHNSGVSLGQVSESLDPVAPGERRQQTFRFATGSIQPGEFLVTAKVFNGPQEIAICTAGGEISSSIDQGVGLTGSISVDPSVAQIGEEVTVSYSVDNSGNVPVTPANLDILFVDPTSGDVAATLMDSANLEVGESFESVQPGPTNLQPGDYLVVLQGGVGNERETLANTILKIEQSAQLACDVDGNSVIDRNDINAIFAARGTQATGPEDPRDENGDGIITINDGRACVLKCTNPRCAP